MPITTIIINDTRYPAVIWGGVTDPEWNNRKVRKIKMAESMETMQTLFPAGGLVSWATVNTRSTMVPQTDEDGNVVTDEDGQPVYIESTEEYTTDMSDWPLCGSITDNRDGTYTVKMGQRLSREVQSELDEANAALRIIMEGE